MSTLEIIAVAFVALLVLLVVGGMLANARWRRAGEAELVAALPEVNHKLAEAHAQDKGWEPNALAAAARRAFAEARVADEIRSESLVAVKDLPGTDADQAVFRFEADSGIYELTLGRRGHEWYAVGVERVTS